MPRLSHAHDAREKNAWCVQNCMFNVVYCQHLPLVTRESLVLKAKHPKKHDCTRLSIQSSPKRIASLGLPPRCQRGLDRRGGVCSPSCCWAHRTIRTNLLPQVSLCKYENSNVDFLWSLQVFHALSVLQRVSFCSRSDLHLLPLEFAILGIFS